MTYEEKIRLNKAITEMTFASIRINEIENQSYLKDLILTALEVGVCHDAGGIIQFTIWGVNMFIYDDAVRQHLDKYYEYNVAYPAN